MESIANRLEMPTLVFPLKEIKCGTPPSIHKAGVGLNRASARFTHSLCESKTEYARTCRLSEFFATGQKLGAPWQPARRDFYSGDAYARVVDFAFNPKVKR
jgi:hypothetical protein